jgi:D-tyrosyl-tRNA(Tyr) deacylase
MHVCCVGDMVDSGAGYCTFVAESAGVAGLPQVRIREGEEMHSGSRTGSETGPPSLTVWCVGARAVAARFGSWSLSRLRPNNIAWQFPVLGVGSSIKCVSIQVVSV